MRVGVLVSAAVLLIGPVRAEPQQPAPQPAQQPTQQPPVFRGGVELLTVDATVVDADGRQIKDLKVADFTVDVDGKRRPIVSAEYIPLVDETPVPVGAKRVSTPTDTPDAAFFSTNTHSPAPGRVILLLVDQGNIRAGQGRQIMRTAARFVDNLDANDRVGLLAVPGPGPVVDFTTDHEKVREGLLATVGLMQKFQGRFNISLSEAIATVEHSDVVLTQTMVLRECAAYMANPAAAQQCELEVDQECSEITNQLRQQTTSSLRTIRDALKSLAPIEGPKSVILISEGLVLEGLGSDADDIAAVAADVRASLDVMLLDVPSVDVADAQRPSTPREDRDLQVRGLETLAGAARGGLHRIFNDGQQAFARVLRSMAGYYLIAVEATPADRDGRRHRVTVKSTRRGTTTLARRGFLAPTSPAASSPADAVAHALRAPLTMNDLPMRLATWTYKEPGTARVKLLVTAEIERGPAQPLAYTAGVMLVDSANKVVASSVEPKTLTASASDPAVAVYAGTMAVEPGSYRLRFAVADSEGRIGSIERPLAAWQMNGAGLTLGDLLLAPPADGGGGVVPAIEPVIGNGRLAALVEVYAPSVQQFDGVQATLDIVSHETEKPITSTPMQLGRGASSEIGSLQAMVNTAALPPGRYLARATVVQAGKPQGHLVRPFRVVGGSVAAAAVAGARTPTALPHELAEAILKDFPLIERSALLAPDVLAAVVSTAEKARPAAAAKPALQAARGGKLGPAALAALDAGDQVLAAFFKGLDLYTQGQIERAGQQFQVAMQQAPTFAPVRMYLGAVLSQINKPREAASLLSSVPPDAVGPAPVARLAAINWLHAGDAGLAIESLERAVKSNDPAAPRALGMAYIVGNRAADALPLLAATLEHDPADQGALVGAIYAAYVAHAGGTQPDTLAADRARAQTWAKAYASANGPLQNLVGLWMKSLEGQ